MLFALAGLLGLLTCLRSAHADEIGWPRFRGPNGDGVAKNQDIPIKFTDDNILWKTPIAGLGNSSPIVWKDLVFLQSSSMSGDQRTLICLDASTGKQNWSRAVSARKSPIHAKNTLASSTPVTDGEAVYISYWDGQDIFLAAYSFKGDSLWNKKLGPWVSEHGAGASPILYKDKVIFFNDMDRLDQKKKAVSRPSTLLALDKKTGAIVWEVARDAHRACYSTPFILETPGKAPELIAASTTAISGLNPDNGNEIWTWKWTFTAKSPLRTIAAPFVLDGLLFAFSGDGGGDRQMFAISLPGTGPAKSVWENKKDFPYVPCCVASGANIYFANDRGIAGCFEARTGKKIWMERLPEATFTASPVLIDGNVYAPSEQGEVFVFAAEPTFKLLAQNSLGETIRATPAVADGRLFIRGQYHLFCIGKKK
jgi:outer membrane protein assembly factor BamB